MIKVAFEKPGVTNLKEFSYADMHYHTRYSDGRTRIDKAIKKCKKKGIGIAITDHNDVRGSIIASKHKGIMVVPGIEVGVKEGAHILFYFHNIKELEGFYLECIRNHRPADPMRSINRGISDVMDIAEKYNGVSCAPHPFLKTARTSICKAIHQGRINREVLDRIQLIEAINGLNPKRYNMKAAALASKLKKGITAGSDGHTTRELGKVLTYTSLVENNEQFLEEVIRKKSYVIGKHVNAAARILPYSAALKGHMKHPIYWMREVKKILKEKNIKLKQRLEMK